MFDRPHVLLPPSQGKAEGGRGRFRTRSGTFASLSASRAELVEAVVAAGRDDLTAATKLFGAKGPLLDRAVESVVALEAGTAPALPAFQRYTGVVWDHLAPDSLDDHQRGRILVPSALLGLVTGTDATPDYRLTFTASVPGLGRLDRWWRPELTKALSDLVDGGTVVEMLPVEHQRALDLDEIAVRCRLVRVRFVSSGGSKAAGHAAKAVKGIAARTLLADGLDALAGLWWEGWRARCTADDVIEVAGP